MAGRQRFGSVRKRDSGRYQVRYLGPDGTRRSAPQTFARKAEALRYLALIEAQMMRGEWIDSARSDIRLEDYATRWITERANLRPRTVQLYTWLLGKHITPYLGLIPLGKLDTALIREWRATLLSKGVSANMVAKAYRLLRAVLMTAVKEDEILRKNPCRIPGADVEKPPERPVLTIVQVLKLASLMPERYRSLVLLATFASLRWGEVTALQRQDIDLEMGTVRVRQAFVEQRGAGLVLGPPKSRAGRRVISIPASILPAVDEHLTAYVGGDSAAFVFTVPAGRPIWRGNFNKLVQWSKAMEKIGVPSLHFHDLRHTGNMLAARTGANLRDLMARMGHDSAHAAMVYQHATDTADREIADAVSAQVDLGRAATETLADPKDHPVSPSAGARGGPVEEAGSSDEDAEESPDGA